MRKNIANIKYLRSPLNYIGGKYKLLPQIIPLIPSDIGTFVDLFCGGCNVGINVSANKIIFNDNLIFLIDLFKAFQANSLDHILNHISQQIDRFSLSLSNTIGYQELRDFYNTNRFPLDLFVLIAYSFNHQIRFNNAHQFNNPFGKDRSSYNPSMQRNLIDFCTRLHGVNAEFSTSDFDKFDFSILAAGDYVYCDPPYLITTGTYNDGKRGFTGWNDSSERKLLAILDSLNSKSISFGLSNVLTHKGNSNEILIDWLQSRNYKVFHLNKSYSNSNYHSKISLNDVTDEVFITNCL